MTIGKRNPATAAAATNNNATSTHGSASPTTRSATARPRTTTTRLRNNNSSSRRTATADGGGRGPVSAAALAVRIVLLTVVILWLAMFLAVAMQPTPATGRGHHGDGAPQGPAGIRAVVRGAVTKLKNAREKLATAPQNAQRAAAAAAAGEEDVGMDMTAVRDVARGAVRRAGKWEESAIDRAFHLEQRAIKTVAELEERAVGAVRHGLRKDNGRGGADGAASRIDKQLKRGGVGADDRNKKARRKQTVMFPHEDGYHHRAELAALASVRTPATIVATSRTDTTTPTKNYIDMRDLTTTLPFANPDGGAWKQGWNVEPTPLLRSDPLQVFVVPHAHCDPGWIKTFDEYFQSQTRGILTTVYNALRNDARRKFIWAEISYFEWWWREQSESVRDGMRALIKSGQFEFVTGGWVQPDEANTQRFAIEVQLQEGHDWLRATFPGMEDIVVPKYGWSIDPFGYSPTMADVLKDYGFEGMLIQRVHYAVKKELAERKHLEFNWRQTWDESGSRDIFTHVMPFYSYDVPHTCGPDPAVCCQFDFARLNNKYGGCPWKKPVVQITKSNVAERAMLLLDQYQKKASLYRSNVVIAPLGDDFRYRDADEAEKQYTNYQMIIDYLNDNVPGVKIQFGTLSDYFEAVKGKFEPPVLKGSFFTYADRDEDYWSGYFTSRVFDKALDRKLEQVLYAAMARGATVAEMQGPRRALSLFQHHDGVTGTAKDHVVEDYAKQMLDAISHVQDWMAGSLKSDDLGDGNKSVIQPCWKASAPRSLGHNDCDLALPVYVYNPLPLEQMCGKTVVPPREIAKASLPCEVAGPASTSSSIKFDPTTGMMTHPIKEEWMVWKVQRGGAYLFFPGTMEEYLKGRGGIVVEQGGYVVSTPNWKRTIVEKQVPDESGSDTATVIDLVFKTRLFTDNEEWLVRFSSPISNDGVFHTDLNGFNFDTHHFRSDLPIQSQVFPMPTLASIQDTSQRLTVLSEHAQGTASLQNGSIDVWLDRRLAKDDDRGLGQGVRDNVPTRTRLRLVLEDEGFETDPSKEFEITKLCKHMWDELNHPLEVFGTHQGQGAAVAEVRSGESGAINSVVPFVYMVHKRVDYLRHAIDSLRASDFPKTVPLVISHDGHVEEMIAYVETLKNEFNIHQVFHPYACFDHPNSFPADDPELNKGYAGDAYGNERSPWATCAKHHWTWMMKHVWDMDFGSGTVDSMVFMEEDYVVSPSIYSTVNTGLELSRDDNYFGIVLDITYGGVESAKQGENWRDIAFRTGPMALPRRSWQQILDAKNEYCTFDEYNWDWSVVHLQAKGLVPYSALAPSFPQVRHIGAEGMHVNSEVDEDAKDKRTKKVLRQAAEHWTIPEPFHSTQVVSQNAKGKPRIGKGNGGWGHPKDQEHCLKVLDGAAV